MKQGTLRRQAILAFIVLIAIGIAVYLWPSSAPQTPVATTAAPGSEQPAPAHTEANSSVTVRTLAGGKVVPEVGVLLQHLTLSDVFFTERTDNNGEAHFSSVPVGAYRVTTMHLAYSSRSRTLGVGPGQHSVTVELEGPAPTAEPPAAPPSAAEPTAQGSVTGRVVDAAGAPIAGAQVGASGEGLPHFTTSDDSGDFELLGLSGERVNLFATESTHAAAQRRDIPVNSHNVELVMQRAGEVSGQLEFTQPVAALFVRLCHIDPDFGKEVCVKSEYYAPPAGEYRLGRVPSGKFSLVFSDRERELKRIPLQIAPGQHVVVPPQKL